MTRRIATFVLLLAAPAAAFAQQNVSWTNTVNATATGNTLQKTSGCNGCPDGGGVSQQQISSGAGSVAFTPVLGSSANLALYAGLGGALSTPPVPAELDYAFTFWASGGWDIRESGDYKTEGSFAAGDTFAITVEAGAVVRYYKNGVLVYTSSVTPTTYPYVLGTTLFGAGSAAGAATISTSGSSPPPTSGVPTAYNALTDRLARPKPPVPALGSAGFAFTDPTFSSRMLRVTDGNTRPGSPDRSYRVPSNAHLAAWNAASTHFYVVSTDGTKIPYAFDAAALRATRLQPSSTGNGGMTLAFQGEPQFSRMDPDAMYGVAAGGNNRTIKRLALSTGQYTTLLDLDTTVAGLSGYVGGLLTGGSSPEKLLTFYGGGQQDQHFYALWFPIGQPGARKLVNTLASTINGAPTNITLNFRLHSTAMDKSGRFVFLHPRTPDRSAPRNASPVYLWDTATDVFTAVTSGGADGSPNMLPFGHDTTGYGYWANQDCCTSTTWDAAQWQFRSLTALGATRDLINPVLTPKEVYLSDHSTWNNAQPNVLVPFISSTYRYGNNTVAWRAWDDEIIALQTNMPTGSSATVWRFGHHRSNVADEADPTRSFFWYQPIANVAPNGRWAIFTSNWEKTLGIDAADGHYRQDVFVIELTASSGQPPAGSSDVAWINKVNASADGNTIAKTGGCTTCDDGGGVSQQEITTGNGSIDFTPSVGHRFFAGLGRDRGAGTTSSSIDYAFSFWTNATFDIRENGTYRGEGAYTAGDVFKIAIDGGMVKYYKNNMLIYTSTVPPAYPLGLDTTLITVGSTVGNAHLTK
jgi:hypothetical protein